MNKQTELKLMDIIKLSRTHYLTGIFCMALCLFLEIWFCYYPPRGVIGENVVVVGSVIGNPLVDFDSLWARMINDDQLMLQIIANSEIYQDDDRDKKLNFLNRAIRPNLNFQFENKTLVKISFKRPGFSDVRPFLNNFTDKIIEKLKLMGNEAFATRREKAQINFLRVVERVRFVADLFKIDGVIALLTANGDSLPTNSLHNLLKTTNISSSFGKVILSELLPIYSNAQFHLEQHLKDDLQILELFPRTPAILTVKDTSPTPVQPFYQLIFLLVPLATFLIYIALLILLNQKSQLPNNAGG